MRWDAGGFVHEATIGQEGWESFQILLNGRWDTAFYPSIQDGSPFAAYKLCGPDAGGHGRNWTIGSPKDKHLWRNAAKPGERYLIVVSVDDEGSAKGVTWKPLQDGSGGKPVQPAADPGCSSNVSAITRECGVEPLEWKPLASGQAEASSCSHSGHGHWLVAEPRADMELGDIILIRPGDVVLGSKGLASRSGGVLRIEFVQNSLREQWLQAHAASGEAASGKVALGQAAVGDAAAGTPESVAQGAQEDEIDVEVWRVPDVRGWGHVPAIQLREPTSSLKVRVARGRTVGDLREAVRGGLRASAAVWGPRGEGLEDGRPLDALLAEGGRLFYELYHDVRVYHGGVDRHPRVAKVTVKASATLYDVRAALVSQFWHKYNDIQFVEEDKAGRWTVCDEDARLDGRTQVCAVGGFMEELPAFDVDEEVEVMFPDGPSAGQKVRCRIEGTSDAGEHYDIRTLPAPDLDGGGDRSDKYFPRIPSYWLRKSKASRNAAGGPRARPQLTRETALEVLRELLAGYRSEDFQQRVRSLLAHYPDRIGYIPECKHYTGFYTMRKQVLLSVQSKVLPKYGFLPHQGGTVMMVTAIKQFKGDAEIDRFGLDINNLLQPMYEEVLV